MYQLHQTGSESRPNPNDSGVFAGFESGFDFTGTFTGTPACLFQASSRVVTAFSTSIYRVITEFWPVVFALALPLTPAFSGRTILLKSNRIKLVPVVGLEPTRLFKVPGF